MRKPHFIQSRQLRHEYEDRYAKGLHTVDRCACYVIDEAPEPVLTRPGQSGDPLLETLLARFDTLEEEPAWFEPQDNEVFKHGIGISVPGLTRGMRI